MHTIHTQAPIDIVFRAEDGTIFENEQDVVDYERELITKAKLVQLATLTFPPTGLLSADFGTWYYTNKDNFELCFN